MSVLHVAAPASVGGLESVLVGLCAGLRQTGARAAVAAIVHDDPDRHPVVARLREERVPVHPLVVPVRGYFDERAELRTLLGRVNPDIVHTHGYRADVVDAGVARRAGIPTVTTLHGRCRTTVRSRAYEWFQSRALRRFDAVIAVSRPLAHDLEREGIPADRIHVVPNARAARKPKLDRTGARAALGIPENARVIGWVGRMVPVKGCDVFLDALRLMEDPALEAAVIGSGPEESALRRKAVEGGLRVRFLGERESAADLLPAFDALVLSSRSEGAPMVLLEAMAAGVPIVATAVGGVPDVLTEREALLVRPEDPEAIAVALREVLADPSDAARRAASAWVALEERFTSESWTRTHLEIYRMLAEHPRGADPR